jgi:hypothetical protein
MNALDIVIIHSPKSRIPQRTYADSLGEGFVQLKSERYVVILDKYLE